MPRIRFSAESGSMGGRLSEIPFFPGESMHVTIPEAIGDASASIWFGRLKPTWEELPGEWISRGNAPGELAYTARITPAERSVDIKIELSNKSDRIWEQSLAFNCIKFGDIAQLRDHECRRHWVGFEGGARRLAELPRVFGPRPALQLYNVVGAPPGARIPFVARFRATPDLALEPWFGIASRDGGAGAAVISRPALFLFQNMEYSCIHSAPGFGRLEPGQTASALTRIYFFKGDIVSTRERMLNELASA